MEALIAFLAALVTLRLAGAMAARYRESRRPEYGLWSAGFVAYAISTGALAWAAAYGWGDPSFRAYYLFGGLLTAALLGAGSLARLGWRHSVTASLLYAGLAVGVAIATPIDPSVAGDTIPAAQNHLAFIPARIVAIVGNTVGTLALIAGGLAILPRRRLDGAFLLAGVALAAGGSAVAGLGEAQTSVFVAGAAVLLYAGMTGAGTAWAQLAKAVQTVVERTKGQRHGHGAGTG